MRTHLRNWAAVLAALVISTSVPGAGEESTDAPLFASVGGSTLTPIGWKQLCATYVTECETTPSSPRDIVLDAKARSYIKRVNEWVNHTIQLTDMDHYGMIQWWRYPDDGIGACHSYALLKRRMLIQAGWPRETLLMTIVETDYGRGEGTL